MNPDSTLAVTNTCPKDGVHLWPPTTRRRPRRRSGNHRGFGGSGASSRGWRVGSPRPSRCSRVYQPAPDSFQEPQPNLTAESLANAHLSQGRAALAAQVLDEATQRFSTRFMGAFPFWLDLRRLQAEIRRQQGQVAEAEQIEAQLRNLVSLADPDHRIVRWLRSIAEQAPAESSEASMLAR